MELILKIIISLVASIYYVQRLKKYIENRKNNNVTGDVLFRWESVSLMDKYHIRERFFGGSKLRIKRDARRHEIKYYWISYIPALIFICLSAGIEDKYVLVIAVVNLIILVKLLFDRIENKNAYVLAIDILIYILVSLGYIYISAHIYAIREINHIYKKFMLVGKGLGFQTDVVIPLAILVVIALYSIVKNRFLSLFVCVYTIAITVISVGIAGMPKLENYLMIYFTGYFYITVIIMQYIYNIRALKKITFIN